MAAMNHGANDGDGHIVGVIHEKFVVDGSDWFQGAHSVFAEGRSEILVANGNDLQERKRLLVEGADALVVLPGGPGTWDELWEMACERHVGFHSMPIVCINVDKYYDNFKAILSRAHDDELLYKHPSDILHFEETPEAAVKWIEEYVADPNNDHTKQKKLMKRNPSMLMKMQSNISGSTLGFGGRMSSFFGDQTASQSSKSASSSESGENILDTRRATKMYTLAVFSAGLSLGLLISSRMAASKSIRV